jgi:hypothetical protein
MNDYLPLLVVVGLGGFVIWYLTRQQTPPPVVNTTATQQCGASYLGVGASVPCQLLAAGIKQLSADAQAALKPVTQEVSSQVKTATSGIKPWEYVVTPVAISHATYNEVKAGLNYINPF